MMFPSIPPTAAFAAASLLGHTNPQEGTGCTIVAAPQASAAATLEAFVAATLAAAGQSQGQREVCSLTRPHRLLHSVR